jgi:hypothetical protein
LSGANSALSDAGSGALTGSAITGASFFVGAVVCTGSVAGGARRATGGSVVGRGVDTVGVGSATGVAVKAGAGATALAGAIGAVGNSGSCPGKPSKRGSTLSGGRVPSAHTTLTHSDAANKEGKLKMVIRSRGCIMVLFSGKGAKIA